MDGDDRGNLYEIHPPAGRPDPGPQLGHAEPDDAPLEETALDGDPSLFGDSAVDAETVREILELATDGLADAYGRDEIPDHWRMQPGELDTASRAAARLLSRSELARRVAGGERGDALTLAVVTGKYAYRNVMQQVLLDRTQEDHDDGPADDGEQQDSNSDASPGGLPADVGRPAWGRPE